MMTLGQIVVFLVAVLSAVHGENATNSEKLLAPSARAAGPTEFPHQVSIRLDERHICGGALISRQHVLTAAHCVHLMIISPESTFVKGQRMLVEVGSNSLGHGTKYRIKRVSHMKYYVGFLNWQDAPFVPNDIAVITLEEPVTSANVKPIRLPNPYSIIPDDWPTRISGFGSQYRRGPVSEFLLTSPMRVTSEKDCNDYYKSRHHWTIISSHICAKLYFGHGTCGGDSGGALIDGDTVVGVVSGGNGNCGSGYTDVYTRVSHFIPYIKSEMSHNPLRSHVAVDIEEAPVDALPPWKNLWRYNIQFIDPHTEQILPPGSVEVLLDPLTGRPIPPLRQEAPIIPLYPIYLESFLSASQSSNNLPNQ